MSPQLAAVANNYQGQMEKIMKMVAQMEGQHLPIISIIMEIKVKEMRRIVVGVSCIRKRISRYLTT